MILALPVLRQNGEDRILGHLTSKLLVQPISKQVLGILQQRLDRKEGREKLKPGNGSFLLITMQNK